MEINTTRDIGRQILRHRSFTFQEFSQRYADPTKDMGFVTREARLQDTKNRQNSVETDDETLQGTWEQLQNNLTTSVQKTYEWAIRNGIAKEQARAVLPEGLTMSRMYMKGSLRSWIHYCQVRMDPATQKEHREIATDAWYEITKVFPSLKDALDI
jgi:thymidylate synthase (FAD)